MKKISYFILALFALIFAASCEKTVIGPTIVIADNDVPYVYTPQQNANGEFGIVFGSYGAATRAKAVSLLGNGYDDFSLFAWNDKNDTIMNPYTVNAYKDDVNGVSGYSYENVGTQELQYFKNNTNYYEFVGVIPTGKTTTLSNGVVAVNGLTSFAVDDERVENGNLAVNSDDEFLYAYKKVEKANYGSIVELPFNHGNALLYLGFKSDRNDTELLNYTPYVPYQAAQPAIPGTVSTESRQGQAINELVNGSIVGWPYSGDTEPSNTANQNGGPCFKVANYGGITDEIANKVNAQFVYYKDSEGNTLKTDDFGTSNKKDNIFIKLSDGVNTNDFANGNDEFWNNISDVLKNDNRIKNCYNNGWRAVKIDKSYNNNWTIWFLSNANVTLTVTSVSGGSPAIPEVQESGQKGVRVFSASYDGTNYSHEGHTTLADANVSLSGINFTTKESSTDVIEFSLPETTILNSTPVFSPTTFYAIPNDANITHFIIKLSYTYNGVSVYDVRVPIDIPNGGFVAGKYYKYIINIKSTYNGTDKPTDAETDKDEIDVVTNKEINVTVTQTDYEDGLGETKVIDI